MKRIASCFALLMVLVGLNAQVVYMDDGEFRWNVMVTKSDTDMFYWSGISVYDGANMIILRDNPQKLITLYLYILQSSPLAESSVTDLRLFVDGVEVPLVRESVLLSEKNKNNMYSHISSYIISENIVQQLANGESVEIRAIVFGKEVRHSLQKSAINGLKSFL